MKEWLKNKLKIFLNIDSLESQFDNHQSVFNNHEKSNQFQINNLHSIISSNYKYLKNDISHFQDSVNILHNTVENVVHIGTDVCQEGAGHSWAVVCVEGKINIVKFVDLNRKDTREIFDFLKHFEGGRHCIDIPYKEMFMKEFFKF